MYIDNFENLSEKDCVLPSFTRTGKPGRTLALSIISIAITINIYPRTFLLRYAQQDDPLPIVPAIDPDSDLDHQTVKPLRPVRVSCFAPLETSSASSSIASLLANLLLVILVVKTCPVKVARLSFSFRNLSLTKFLIFLFSFCVARRKFRLARGLQSAERMESLRFDVLNEVCNQDFNRVAN